MFVATTQTVWSWSRRIALVFGLSSCFVLNPRAAAQPYGLDSRAPIGAFLNQAMPATLSSSGSGNWIVVPAFPNLTFEDPTFLTGAPRTNRLYVCGRQGMIWTFVNNSNTATKTVFLDLRAKTQGWGDCGLLGMAFHPDFNLAGSPNRGYVYVYYAYSATPTSGPNPPGDDTPTYNRLSRFTVPDGSLAADPASEQILINQYDRQVWHSGGGMFFGSDGFLYLTIGDEGGMSDLYNSAQKLNGQLRSGIFRIDVNRDPSKSHPIRRQPQSNGGVPASSTANYYVPNDNPFLDPGGSVLEEYWALGLRSPHRVSFDSVSGRIWLGDVGQDYWEELNVILRGANYQWPFRDGDNPGPKPPPSPIIGTSKPPLYQYPHEDGNNCIIGGYVYRGQEHAADLTGKYVFGDNGSGRIWATTYDGVSPPVFTLLCSLPPSSTYEGMSSFGLDQNNEIYICKMGSVGIVYKLGRTIPPTPPPPRLALTGAFSNLQTLAPATGLVPYDLNVPFWSDAAVKRRWIAVPNDGAPYSTSEAVSFAPNGEWFFPNGTVFVKHFELSTNDSNPLATRRLETRLLVRNNNGGVYGVTYKWRPDNSDADLLTTSLNEDIVIQTPGGTRVQTWYYPSPQDCLTCHNAVGVLGPKTRQLNGNTTYPSTGQTDNQLRTWSHIGLLIPSLNEANIPAYAKLAPMSDTSASPELRVRSYLDANCMQCHRPNGVQAHFDARFDTPLGSQGIIDGLLRDDAGIPGAKVVAPQSLSQSMMYLRMNSTNPSFMMPPLARHLIDTQAVAVLADWINTLQPVTGALPSPWNHQDIGPVAAAGDAHYTNGVFTVSGSGVDIWYQGDEFQFVYRPMTGDGEIIARVLSVQNTDPWAKAGVMMRNSLDPESADCYTLISAANGSGFQWRFTLNGNTDGTIGPLVNAPYWVRAVRTGNAFAGYVSVDGSSWTLVNAQTIAMGSTIYVGLAVSARNDGQINTSTFSDVQVISSGGGGGGALPAPWSHQDIGSVGAPGSAVYTNGIFTVSGSGTDIWYASDEFQFVYRTLTNDGEIVARVTAVQNTDPWAKAGVMMRDSLNPGSANSYTLISATNGSGFQWRFSLNGNSDGTVGPLVNAPYWVRAVRTGNSFSGYVSADGSSWTLVNSQSITMGSTIYVGLAVSARNDGQINTSTFTDVQVNSGSVGGGNLPAPWNHQDIGPVAAAGSASFTNGIFTVRGSGADIWYVSDEFQFVYRSLTNDGQISARVTAVQNTDAWAKGGVMMRESLDPGARNLMATVTAANGTGLQWRSTAYGPSDGTDGPFVMAPYWVRVVRKGNLFSGYTSADGTNWTLISSQTNLMSGSIYAGLAVTSRNDGLINTSTFSNVQLTTDAAPRFTQAEFDSQQHLLLHFDGEVGRSYSIQISTNLLQWAPFTTISNLLGPTTIIDSNATSRPRGFYRAVLNP